jgi:hypothetical protein
MAQNDFKLTANTGEADIAAVLGSGSIFAIPFFQRPYKWSPQRITQFNRDLLAVVDGQTDAHFLGAIIIHGMASDPSGANIYEVIDGQQRLTTLYLYLAAVIKTLAENDQLDEAARLYKRYMIANVEPQGRSNLILQPSKEDQSGLNSVIQEVIGTNGMDKKLAGFPFIKLPGTVPGKGKIVQNFGLAKKFFREQMAEGGLDRVGEIYRSLLQRMSIVQISVVDPLNGPRIFDSLNSGQEPMTIGDLVRNDVFARTATKNPQEAAMLDEDYWQPFYARFQIEKRNYFDAYFFPFGLIHDPNLRKSEVHASLKARWKDAEPTQVIDELKVYQDAFLDFIKGSNLCAHPKDLALRFQRLNQMGAPSSILPFVMQLSRACQEQQISNKAAIEILEVLDSFLTRRALCGHEPTGLHAVFKRLWDDSAENRTAAGVSAAISRHKTVAWPTAEDVRSSVLNRPLYRTSIDSYVILEYDLAQGGDQSGVVPWIEHVLPVTPGGGWPQFSTHEHAKMKDLFANLIPLTSDMNVSVSNSPYAAKRKRYEEDSLYKSARQFATQYSDWTPQLLEERGEKLAQWVIQRWGYERSGDAKDTDVTPFELVSGY